MPFPRRSAIVSLTALLLTAPAHAAAPTQAVPTAGKSGVMSPLVKQSCSACHELARVTSQHHDAAGWSVIVDKMIGMGAQISDADADKIVAWLATHQGPAAK